MARRITHAQFSQALASGTMSAELLADYVTLDASTGIPTVRFRADALLDIPPHGYDVDDAVYLYLRAQQKTTRAQTQSFEYVGKKSVVAEGDSWFALPAFLRVPAIADRIGKDGRFVMENIAHWGHTLRQIIAAQEYARVLQRARPDYFMISGGGNDLQEGLANGSFIYAYDPARTPDAYLTPAGMAALDEIEKGYQAIFDQVSPAYPTMPVLCFGYDYPRPLVGDGVYIGRHLRAKGIPDRAMEPIMDAVIDKLNARIKRVASGYAKAIFLDCRTVTKPDTWVDDMHPGVDGFKALAAQFEGGMSPA